LYIEPLREYVQNEEEKIIETKDIDIIFSNIEQIHSINAELLKELEDRLRNWQSSESNHDVGDIFLKLSPFLRLYLTYIKNYDKANTRIKSLMKSNKTFKAFCQERKGMDLNRYDLTDFLIMPVQRIPRYILLLQELILNTPPTLKDYATCTTALKVLKDVATSVNGNMGDTESSHQLLKVQRSFLKEGNIDIMAPGRKFLKQSTISIISPTRVKKIPYTLFLFSDILVIAKKNVLGNYQLKAHVALLVINVKDIEVAPIEDDDPAYYFELIAPSKVMVMCARTKAEKQSLMHDIRSAKNTMLIERGTTLFNQMKAKHHRTVVVFSGQVTEISQDGVQDVKENFFTQTFVAGTNFVAPEAENKEPDISPRDGKKHKRHRTNDDADEISDSEFQALSSYILPTPPRASMKPSNSNPNSLQSSMDSITNNTATTNNTNNNASNGSQSSPVTPRRKLDSSSRNSSSENLMANVSPNGGNSPPVAPRRKLDNSSRNNSNSGAEPKSPPNTGGQSPPISPRRKLSASGVHTNMANNNNVIIEKHEEIVTVLTLDSNLPKDTETNGTTSTSAQNTPRHVSQNSTHKNSPKAVMTNFANSIQRAFSTKSKKKRTDSINKESNLASSNGSDIGPAPTSPTSPPERTHKPKNRSDNARKFLKGLFQLRSARAKNASKSQELTTGNNLIKSQDINFNTAPNSTEVTSDSSSPTQSTSTSPRETQQPRYEPLVQTTNGQRDSRPLPLPRARSPTYLADNLSNSGSSPKVDNDNFSLRQRASTDAHRSKRLPAPPVPPRRTKPKLTGTLSNVGSTDDVMSDAVDAMPQIGPGVLSDDNLFVPSRDYRVIERRRVELHRSKSVATLNELLRGLDPSLLAEINGTASNTNDNTHNKPSSPNGGTNSGPGSYLSPKGDVKRRSVSMRDVHLPLEESSE
jgi:hypothetical protein